MAEDPESLGEQPRLFVWHAGSRSICHFSDESFPKLGVAHSGIRFAKTHFTIKFERGALRGRKLIQWNEIKSYLDWIEEAKLQRRSMLDERFPSNAHLVISDDSLDANKGR
ncbi:hypothetical protein [Herbaspirillum rubrisubalbicans]|uniref:hypothetical protein n=1 Tax=Herbaspirillum rubrisubalbicans TaxID=80842 RepID=UPI0015C5656F|nr:hypothetical protein [Herbaspirillum rubrisubalbicans]